MTDEEYQAEYDKATAALDAGTPIELAKTPEPEIAKVEEPKAPEVKVEEPVKEVDPLQELREKVEKTEKALKDTQAWGTKNAQELANLRREQQEREHALNRPAILDANPELEAAIKYVNPQPVQQHDSTEQWRAIVSKAHPGIFDVTIDPELEQALMVRLQSLGKEVEDPLIVIREISLEKQAHTERMIGKRFAAEAAKAAQKTAMSVPGAGVGGARTAPQDADLEAKNRILNMSPSEFEKERRKVIGY